MVMITRQGGSSGEGTCSGSGSGVEPIDERMCEFITSEVTHDILEQTPVTFSTINERIMEILDELLGMFRSEILADVGGRTLTYREFRACGAPKFFEKKEPIVCRWWLADMVNTFRTSFCPEGSKVKFTSYLLKDRARDW